MIEQKNSNPERAQEELLVGNVWDQGNAMMNIYAPYDCKTDKHYPQL